MSHTVKCPRCNGDGQINETRTCTAPGCVNGQDTRKNPPVPCVVCHGTGIVTYKVTCPTCNGTGLIEVPDPAG
jgi:RecJ-like exonuclease